MRGESEGRVFVKGVAGCLIVLAVLLACVPLTIWANDCTLSGVVSDSTGSPIQSVEIKAVDSITRITQAVTITNALGYYALSIPPATYDIIATPPVASGFQSLTILGLTLVTDMVLDIVLVMVTAEAEVILSGTVVGPLGNALANQRVALKGESTYRSTETDSSGHYSIFVPPGDYTVEVEAWRGGNPASANAPRWYELSSLAPLSLTNNTVMDIAIAAKRVTVRVQDPAGNPVAGAKIATDEPVNSELTLGTLPARGSSSSLTLLDRLSSPAPSGPETDSTGTVILWLFPTAPGLSYTFTVYPPSGSGLSQFAAGNVAVVGDKTVIISLQASALPVAGSPTAQASDISGKPQIMYPDTVYSVTAKYYDPDGRGDLKICYLQLKHPEKRLTMMWYQEDGNTSTYAGEEGENYLSNVNVTPTEITDAAGNEGYELTWTFQINDQWPEVENAIDFGVFASDDSDLISDWDYDDTNATFSVDNSPPQLIQDFTASDGEDSQSVLSWTNPPDSDLNQVVVKRKTDGYPSGHTDGDTRITIDAATPGREEAFVDGGLTNGQTYYYAVFSRDTTGNWNDDWEEGKNACTGTPTAQEIRTDLQVPYYNQGDTLWCWAASSSMVLKYWGIDKEPWEIAAHFDKPPEGDVGIGVFEVDELKDYLKSVSGLNWVADDHEAIDGDLKRDIINALEAWESPVMLIAPGICPPLLPCYGLMHVIVITGYSGEQDLDYIFFHDPSGVSVLTGHTVHQKMTWLDFFQSLWV